jgi:hypothetical protein
MNNNFMNPGMNTARNSCAPNFNYIPINAMPCMQQNFGNLGGNMNNLNMGMNNLNYNNITPMNNMININNINNHNNFNPLRTFHSEEIGQKLDFDSEINIKFSFVNSQSFQIKAKPKEKLKDIINRFKNNECPKELKDNLSVCLCHGQKADQNKTLLELGIKDGERLLFTIFKKEEQNEKKDKNKIELNEREREQLAKLRLEYNEKYLHKELNKLKLDKNNDKNYDADDEEEIPSFRQYCALKDRKIGVEVKEHIHKLVYCLTNISWVCNICKMKYKKEAGKYYCSLCDYSMCESCHYYKKYFMKKSFPKGTKPSNDSVNIHFLDTDYHEHRLAFCRSSRHFIYFNEWICNNCREKYDNDKWSFYCTLCDFDLCCDCCGYH